MRGESGEKLGDVPAPGDSPRLAVLRRTLDNLDRGGGLFVSCGASLHDGRVTARADGTICTWRNPFQPTLAPHPCGSHSASGFAGGSQCPT